MQKKTYPLWSGILGYTIFFVTYINYSIILVQFTTLSAVVGSAACALIIAFDEEENRKVNVIDLIFIIFFAVVSYLIRAKAGYVILVWCLAAAGIKLFHVLQPQRNKLIKKFTAIFFCIGVLLFISVTVHNNFYSEEDWREYREYSSERGQYKDYPHISYEEDTDLYEEVGWSETLYDLVSEWFFMDRTITKETFETLNAAYSDTSGIYDKACNSFEIVKSFILEDKTALLNSIGIICICLLSILETIKTKQFQHVLGIAGALFLLAAFWLYLGKEGRINFRVFQLCIIPGAVIMFMNLLLLFDNKWAVKPRVVFLYLAGVVFAGQSFLNLYEKVYDPDRLYSINQKKLLENYFAENEKNIYVYDSSIQWMCAPELYYENKIPNNYFF